MSQQRIIIVKASDYKHRNWFATYNRYEFNKQLTTLAESSYLVIIPFILS